LAVLDERNATSLPESDKVIGVLELSQRRESPQSDATQVQRTSPLQGKTRDLSLVVGSLHSEGGRGHSRGRLRNSLAG